MASKRPRPIKLDGIARVNNLVLSRISNDGVENNRIKRFTLIPQAILDLDIDRFSPISPRQYQALAGSEGLPSSPTAALIAEPHFAIADALAIIGADCYGDTVRIGVRGAVVDAHSNSWPLGIQNDGG
ncbi:MAG: hypothetical protein ACXAEI_00955 [Candidatus Hodarchaeales archaeon]